MTRINDDQTILRCNFSNYQNIKRATFDELAIVISTFYLEYTSISTNLALNLRYQITNGATSQIIYL